MTPRLPKLGAAVGQTGRGRTAVTATPIVQHPFELVAVECSRLSEQRRGRLCRGAEACRNLKDRLAWAVSGLNRRSRAAVSGIKLSCAQPRLRSAIGIEWRRVTRERSAMGPSPLSIDTRLDRRRRPFVAGRKLVHRRGRLGLSAVCRRRRRVLPVSCARGIFPQRGAAAGQPQLVTRNSRLA
jgi:hypothetical protein